MVPICFNQIPLPVDNKEEGHFDNPCQTQAVFVIQIFLEQGHGYRARLNLLMISFFLSLNQCSFPDNVKT